MIKTVGLKKLYTTEEVETTALINVNLEIQEGEFVAIIGAIRMRQVDATQSARSPGQPYGW